MFIELIKGVALLLALCLLQGFVLRHWRGNEILGKIVSGLLFGGICVIGMKMPLAVAPGVIFDAHSVILSMAGLFGGPVVGIIAAAIAAAYRLWLGGDGAAVGLAVIISAMSLGLLYGYCSDRGWVSVGVLQLLAFGLIVHAVVVLLFTLLPADVVAQVMEHVAIPLVLIFTPATVFLGLLLRDIYRRVATEDALRTSEERFHAFIDYSPSKLHIKDTDGRYLLINHKSEQLFKLTNEQAKGKTTADIFPSAMGEDFNAHDRAVVTTGQPIEAEESFTQDDGVHTYLTVKFPIFGADGSVVAVGSNGIDITERKQFEDQLRLARDNLENKIAERTKELTDNETRFRAVTESAKDAIVSVDKGGLIVHWNRGAQKIFGYSAAEIIGQPVAVLIPERYRGAHTRGFENLMAGGKGRLEGVAVELEAIRKDGSECSIEQTLSDWAIGDDKFVTGIMRDIGDRQKVAKELRASESTLSAFLDATIDFAALLDRQGRFLIVNKAMADQYGVDRDALIGRPMLKIPLTETGERRQKWIDDVFNSGKPLRATDVHEGRWYDNSYFPVYDDAGKISSIAVFAREITEMKEAEENLRQLSRAVEQDPNAVFITDMDGKIQFVNAMFTKSTGYTADEAIGQNASILKSGSTPREVYLDLWETIKAGKDWRSEIKDRRKDGSFFWVNETIGPVKDENGTITHYVATHEDITQRRQSENSMRQALEQAKIANRAKTELLANMSHELRTPLNAIIGFTGSITAEIFGPIGNEKYLEYIKDIGSSGEHLLELINDILDVSAIEAGKFELHEDHIVVDDLVAASLRLVVERAERKRIVLRTTVAQSLPLFYGDERRLKQILLNLLSNAVKFTPDGGLVTLSASLADGGGHVFKVTDSGIGMSHGELVKAMTQFGQVDSGLSRKEEGAGLGLPLTKGLVELHGGTFDITSDKASGTTVIIKFSKDRVV